RRRRRAVAATDVDVDLAAAAHERVDDRTEEHALPEPARGLADDDLADVARARVGEKLVAHARAGERHGLRAETLGEAQRLEGSGAVLRAEVAMRRRLDVRHDPWSLELCGQASARAHQSRRHRARPDADQ